MSDRTSLVRELLVRQSQQPVWDDRTWVMVNTVIFNNMKCEALGCVDYTSNHLMKSSWGLGYPFLSLISIPYLSLFVFGLVKWYSTTYVTGRWLETYTEAMGCLLWAFGRISNILWRHPIVYTSHTMLWSCQLHQAHALYIKFCWHN